MSPAGQIYDTQNTDKSTSCLFVLHTNLEFYERNDFISEKRKELENIRNYRLIVRFRTKWTDEGEKTSKYY